MDIVHSLTSRADEIAPLMILGVTEMWVVLIASSVAPLWPLVKYFAKPRSPCLSQQSYDGFSSGQGKYLKSGTLASGFLHSYRTEHSRDVESRDGSEDAIVVPDGIVMTHHVSIRHERAKDIV
jgi:hypothetical protein